MQTKPPGNQTIDPGCQPADLDYIAPATAEGWPSG
jgi:hypothetical protein